MNQRVSRNFFAIAFLAAAPLLGSSCASSQPKSEVPPAVVQSSTDAQNSGAATAAPSASPTPSTAAAPVARKKTTVARMVCDLDKDKRTVVYKMKGAGCQVTYTKLGQSHVAAESADGTNHCDNVFDRIKQNLTASGYACRETD